jgi:peptide deformylase
MAVLPIVRYPHEALSTPAQPVTVFDEALGTFIDDLAETMYAANGVGLAANQVAVLQRVTVIDTASSDEPAELIELVNPVVVERSEEPLIWEEGCLSFPELFEKVERAARVRVAYVDRHGAPHELEAEGLLSVALQHEIDHLDGVVFVDKVSRLARVRALRRFEQIMARRREEGEEPA